MPPEPRPVFAAYDERGTRRHLVVSDRLRRRRQELGLTQMDVVVRLRGLGVNTTNKTVSSLEHGAGLDLSKLPEIARALECTITYLVGLTDAPARWEPDDPGWPRPEAAPHREEPADQRADPRAGPRAGPRAESEQPWILGPLELPRKRRA